MNIKFVEVDAGRTRERVAQVYNENFSELFELLYEGVDLSAWRPMLSVPENRYGDMPRNHDLRYSLGHDETALLTHIASHIAGFLTEDETHCMVGVERLVRTAKLPGKRRFGRSIRIDDYMYTCLEREHTEKVRDFVLTATFQSNFFLLTKRAAVELEVANIHELCKSWATSAKAVILSVLDDDNFLVLSRP